MRVPVDNLPPAVPIAVPIPVPIPVPILVPILVLLVVAAVTGCAPAVDAPGGPVASPPTPPSSAASSAPASSPAAEPASPVRPPRPRPPRRGVDVSHHQGDVDWSRVAGDGISFAYLKATEGSTFTDPALATNWAGARQAGLRVGGYHYYSLCSPPEPQADHFVAALTSVGATGRSLPPVVDLELIGNCDPPPGRAALLAATRTFIDRVESATGRRVVVYAHPELEATYGLVDDLDRRLWVRRTGARPPPGDWWLWQRSDHAQVDGIGTPVDLDLMR